MTTSDLLWSLDEEFDFFFVPVYRRNVSGIDDASCSLSFRSSRVTSAFVVDLYVGLPQNVPSVTTRSRASWDLPGKFTNHGVHKDEDRLEVSPPTTIAYARQLPVFVIGRRSR